MEFTRSVEKAVFLNPATNEIEEVEIELRTDPLTDKISRILVKPLPFPKNPELPDFSREWCPFCEDRIYSIGARDVRVAGGELMRRNESILMANISPYAEISLVIRISEAHYIPINEFKPQLFSDGFLLALDYIRKIGSSFATVTMNYLRPAGSSISHPHIQLMASDMLFDLQERIKKGAERFFLEEKEIFWDYFWKEFHNNRIHEGKWRFFTPFVPRGFEHVQGYLKKGLLELDEDEINDLSEGIVKILKAYHELGFNSFNFGIFGPVLRKNYLPIIFDIVARTPMDKYYQNDTFAIAKLYDEAYTNRRPEETAEEIKNYF